jgi:3' terminal RNA ribose 2'-O-methyltransferase Hen1
MILISTTHRPATDLGYLLHKHPDRIHSSNLTFGAAHVVYQEVGEAKTSAALLVEIDPVRLVRGKGRESGTLDQYVNDRPYVASSFLSVALGQVFSTAMSGRSKDRQELAETPIPLEIRIPVLPCRKGAEWISGLFQPLGWQVEAKVLPLDPQFEEWGDSRYYDATFTGTLLLKEALRHFYVLLPVLDLRKHYYMDPAEVDKLLAKGEGWLAAHPERDAIVKGSLGRKPSLMREAFEQLAASDEALLAEAGVGPVAEEEEQLEPTPAQERKVSLHQQRHERVVELVRELKPKSVIDLGCGEGALLRRLMPIQGLQKITGMDVSYYDVEKAIRRLRLDDAGPALKERVQIFHGSLMYKDERLAGYDVATVIEVIEHLDPPRLAAFEKVVFGHARPQTVIITTPNREYNTLYDLDDLRHKDHRFEWTRAEFAAWAEAVAERHGYKVTFEGLGVADETHGSPSQMGVFTR